MGNVAPGRLGHEIEIRAVTEDELPDWDRAIARGFLRPHTGSGLHWRQLLFEPGRCLGAFDASDQGRCVATFRSFDTELTVPGGATLPVDAITAVTVTATHRRRGLLTGMINRDLAAARERGSAAAILIAAEYNIYGRYGFGPATTTHGLQIDLARSGGLRPDLPLPSGGRIDFVPMADVRKLGAELHERWRRTQPGAISRSEAWWRLETGDITLPGYDWKEPFTALHRDAEGEVTGLITYTVDDKWDGMVPTCTLTVLDHLALDQPTANALWQLVFSVDWVRTIAIDSLGVDDPLRLLLKDPRGVRPNPDTGDFTWLRLLDLEAAFGARSYAAAGRLVLEVDDPAGHAGGRWALETSADGTGRCVPTGEEPDLALTVGRLGELYLGASGATTLAAAALLTELTPGAAATADLLLRTPRRAWNPDGF
ncbi:GNAT family N-acetyltransferase [Kitasatospora sp. NPDC048540]|uniref:GNAT family N-acetyltransferase n=1 Tax=unclassified Kitasatospora TaxID=2633591 RepID=UPI00068BE5B9|nr:GNAT family N-acetyltransferase [Kitasatospora sp. MBT63]